MLNYCASYDKCKTAASWRDMIYCVYPPLFRRPLRLWKYLFVVPSSVSTGYSMSSLPGTPTTSCTWCIQGWLWQHWYRWIHQELAVLFNKGRGTSVIDLFDSVYRCFSQHCILQGSSMKLSTFRHDLVIFFFDHVSWNMIL